MNTVGSLADLNAKYLKENYLFGLDFVDDNGDPWPDAIYDKHIAAALAEFERKTKVHVAKRAIVDERHDYLINDYAQFAFFSLFEYPVISVETVRAVYPTGDEAGYEFPKEWTRLTSHHGQIQLVPTQGTLAQVILGRGGSYLPIVFQSMGYLPQLFRIDYTVGFDEGKVPEDILSTICKLATIRILTIAQDTVHPVGITNISSGIDGLSQGLGMNPRGAFEARINAYRLELYGQPPTIPGELAEIREHYKGINLRVA